jgi:hypothetical protein
MRRSDAGKSDTNPRRRRQKYHPGLKMSVPKIVVSDKFLFCQPESARFDDDIGSMGDASRYTAAGTRAIDDPRSPRWPLVACLQGQVAVTGVMWLFDQ